MNENSCGGVGNRGQLQGSSHRGNWQALGVLWFACIAAAGCGSSTKATPADAAAGADATAAIGMIVTGTPQPCTAPHSICVSAKFPASMTAQPTKLQIDLFVDIPPTHPPDGIPLMIETPPLTAGQTVQLRMTDLGLTGSYHLLGVLFMPGGGYALPVSNVDYAGDAAAVYTLTGDAINVTETLDFQYFP